MANKPKPILQIGIVVGLLGFLVSSGAAIAIAAVAFVPKTGEPFAVPGSESRVLESGDHDIMGVTGPFRDLEPEPTFEPGDATVTRVETGEQIPVRTADFGALDLRDDERYEGVGSFTVEEPGIYRIDIRSDDDSKALVERSDKADWNELLVPFAFMSIGAILSAAGALMIFVSVVRRRAQSK